MLLMLAEALYIVGKKPICKRKLKVFLDEFCKENRLPKVSESSIGRCIKRLKNRGAIKQYHRVSYYGRTGKIRDFKFKQKVIKQRRNGYYPKNRET